VAAAAVVRHLRAEEVASAVVVEAAAGAVAAVDGAPTSH
jgi:hypothetical protein